MIQVLLLILKILGILLLSILGLIVLLLALVLFVPFRYEAEVDVNLEPQKERQRIQGAAKVHWLLHLVQVRVAYSTEGGLVKRLRIFFIPISLDKKKKDAEGEAANSGASNTGDAGEETADGVVSGAEVINGEAAEAGEEESGVPVTDEGTDAMPVQEAESDNAPAGGEPESSEATDGQVSNESAGSGADEQLTDGTSEEEGTAKKPGLIQKLKGIVDKLKNKLTELRDTAKCMLELFSRKKGLAVEYIKKESTQTALKDVFSTVWWILKSIFPRKYEGDVTFGTGDPEQTGKLFAVAAVLYPVYGTHLTVHPDMEDKVIGAKGSLSGRIRLWGILYRAIRLALNKNLRRVIKQAMHVKDEMMKTPKEIKEAMGKAA